MNDKKVIFIEDDPVFAPMIWKFIETAWVKPESIIHVPSLTEFQKALQAHNFALAILDGRFPKTAGWIVEFNAHTGYDGFRDSPSWFLDWRDTPVILFTGESIETIQEKMQQRAFILVRKWGSGFEKLEKAIGDNLPHRSS
jgi:DNA-binding NtrC family response regulator